MTTWRTTTRLPARRRSRDKAALSVTVMARRLAQRRANRRRKPPQVNYVGHRDNESLQGGIARMVDALAERAANGDLDDLLLLVDIGRQIHDEALPYAVAGLRRHYSERDIAGRLGVTQPAVTQRWPRVPFVDPEEFEQLDEWPVHEQKPPRRYS